MTGITILGTGSYLPERVVANEEFAQFLDTSDEWIVSHTGISERRIVTDEPTWYMGAVAADRALEDAGVGAEEVDMIITSTVTGDYSFPSVACCVQEHIGNTHAFAYDVSAACAGYCFALDMARRYLATGDVRTVLIVSAETLTQTADYDDRGTCVLFGDGAAASVVRAGEGLFAAKLGATPGMRYLYSRLPRDDTPFTKWPEHNPHDVRFDSPSLKTYMDGHEVYRFATKVMCSSVTEACEKVGIAPADLDLIIPHQANFRIIKTAMKNLKLPMEKAYVNIHKYGNTSSASIPIALHEAIEDGSVKRGDKVCVVGFGSGLVYGACVFEY